MEGTAFERFIARHGEERAKVIAEERAKVLAAREVVEMLLAFGPEKLGQPDEATAGAIQALDDLDRLRRMRGRLLKASSWADLLSTP